MALMTVAGATGLTSVNTAVAYAGTLRAASARPQSAIPFTYHQIGTFFGVNLVQAIDLDQDGDIDIFGVSGSTGGGLAWWENDGDENFTMRSVASFSGAHSACPADVDGDGDIDLVASGAGIVTRLRGMKMMGFRASANT